MPTSSSAYPSEAAHAPDANDAVAIENTDPSPQVSRSSRAGLQISVGRVHRQMKTLNPNNLRIGEHAPVLLAAVLEFLVVEIWRLARDTTTSHTINSRHLRRAAENNEELGELLIPHIDAVENAEDDTDMESKDDSENSTCSPLPMAY
ncbi:histone-fold-containing protein [Athelia psychrophila]|uniref:Histone H2A n=1 Tax=Athelia psychrophila TaxID=1759441 RepID=A0A166CS74_9AGAM|nr:histone-fold-containing protein [Fibularhizoctonia sp. CBS 109695]